MQAVLKVSAVMEGGSAALGRRVRVAVGRRGGGQ